MYIQNLHFKRKCYSFVTFANFGKVTHAHQKCAYRILNSLVVQRLGLRAATKEAQVWPPVGAQRPYMPCSTAEKEGKCVFRVCEGQGWFWVWHVSHRNYCMQDTGSGYLRIRSLYCKWQWSSVTSGIIWTPHAYRECGALELSGVRTWIIAPLLQKQWKTFWKEIRVNCL